ncbi:MAG TPA: hypothetical protein VEV37_11570, partial [Bryobacteraceae bacterium]|nr:hypothetical protein [Bryobacteraceae bacterium]
MGILVLDFHFPIAPLRILGLCFFDFCVCKERSSELWNCGNLACLCEISIISTTCLGDRILLQLGCHFMVASTAAGVPEPFALPYFRAMPLQNRVSPYGDLFRTPARGTMMGNRGGPIHNGNREIVRPFLNRRWIACVLEFRGRRRVVMSPHRYTELFFLDEATAFAAGHRPCALCRRADYNRFVAFWQELHPGQVGADAMDEQLHEERLTSAARASDRQRVI